MAASAKDRNQNKETAKSKITTSIPALGGDIYPALGGDYPGNFVFSSLQSLATNVKGVTVPFSRHWIPEEQPEFVVEQLLKFFEEKEIILPTVITSVPVTLYKN